MAPIAPDPSAQLRTIRALRDERFDVVNIHEPFAPGVTQTALLFKSQPLVGTFHAAGEISLYKWTKPLVLKFAKRLDARVAVSDEAAAMARRFAGGEYEVLFNGVELTLPSTTSIEPTHAPTIFFLGRHETRKGLSVLLEALAELPSDVRLWVAGEGPETEALRAMSAGDPRVEWLGRISDGEKHARLRAADVFCAPSLGGESFGVVLLEGMAADTAVVASAIAGYDRVARADVDALLVPPGQPAALAAALSRVLSDDVLRSRLVASGRERAAQFSMDALAERYETIFERVVGRR